MNPSANAAVELQDGVTASVRIPLSCVLEGGEGMRRGQLIAHLCPKFEPCFVAVLRTLSVGVDLWMWRWMPLQQERLAIGRVVGLVRTVSVRMDRTMRWKAMLCRAVSVPRSLFTISYPGRLHLSRVLPHVISHHAVRIRSGEKDIHALGWAMNTDDRVACLVGVSPRMRKRGRERGRGESTAGGGHAPSSKQNAESDHATRGLDPHREMH